jgi:hypothetical protein
MLRHVAVFTFTAEAIPAQVDALIDGLVRLPGEIPEIRDYRFGRDGGLRPGTADFAVVAATAFRPRRPTSTTPTPTGATPSTRRTANSSRRSSTRSWPSAGRCSSLAESLSPLGCLAI